MSLFSISRYTGEENDIPKKKKKQKEASAIIQRLQEEAQSRRKSNIAASKPEVEKGADISVDEEKTIDDGSGDVLDAQKPDSKISRKRKSNTEDDDKTNKHKKKKKHKLDKDNKIIQKDTDNEASSKHDSADKEKETNKVVSDEDIESSETEQTEVNNDKASESLEEGEEEQNLVDIGPGTNQIGGFTVIGNVKSSHLEKVRRVLPDWLSSPTLVSSDLKSGLQLVEDMPGLDKEIIQAVIRNGIKTFFPVQSLVIPALLHSSLTGFHYGRAGYRPSDICVSAPTGSGKTLAFVLPIVQALKSRVTCEVRALAVLPVRDLAAQVFKVFEEYCKGTKLQVGCLIGQKTFAVEQKHLVRRSLNGFKTMYDIIVATPGRLVDHINKTEGFSLAQLRFLVIDEADRMMDEIKQDWLTQTETSVYKARATPTSLTAANCSIPQIPIQKLLYSATLSQNPERLQPLNLFQPKLFTSTAKGDVVPVLERVDKITDDNKTGTTDGGDEALSNTATDKQVTLSRKDLEKYTTPSELSEYILETTSERKPLAVLHLLHNLGYRNILCFTNSVEAAHRLSTLIRLYGGIEVSELSSGYHISRRDKIIQKFMSGKIDVVICSDVIARGIDIANVKYVVSYDPPKYIKTHVHRIGRTARAGKEGVALTLLQKKEFFHFKKILKQAGKKIPQKMPVSKKDLKPLVAKYKEALKQLPAALSNKATKLEVTEKDDSADIQDDTHTASELNKHSENEKRPKKVKKKKRQDGVSGQSLEETDHDNSQSSIVLEDQPSLSSKKKKKSRKKSESVS